jgi:hypothetical protein
MDHVAVLPAELMTEKESELLWAAFRYALELISNSSKAKPRISRVHAGVSIGRILELPDA